MASATKTLRKLGDKLTKIRYVRVLFSVTDHIFRHCSLEACLRVGRCNKDVQLKVFQFLVCEELLPLPHPPVRTRTKAQTNQSSQRATQLRIVLARVYAVSMQNQITTTVP
jgi:hypothetical protein